MQLRQFTKALIFCISLSLAETVNSVASLKLAFLNIVSLANVMVSKGRHARAE